MSQAAGSPFRTQAHALARGDYAVACIQLSRGALLRAAHRRSLKAARRLCVRQLRSAAKDLDEGRRRSLASTSRAPPAPRSEKAAAGRSHARRRGIM
jgi:hypothetical protein